MPVKLILRDKEYEVKPGMTLLSALQKNSILPESVIATCAGEMILEDEILKDGDVIRLIAVISGGSCHCERHASRGAKQHLHLRQAVSPRRAPGPNGVQVSPHEWGIATPLRGSQ